MDRCGSYLVLKELVEVKDGHVLAPVVVRALTSLTQRLMGGRALASWTETLTETHSRHTAESRQQRVDSREYIIVVSRI